MRDEKGGALLGIFVVVALFGLLTYAFIQGSRGSTSWVSQEENKAQAAISQACSQAVAQATKRLQLRGCGTRISTASDGSNAHEGAPADGSCSIFHVTGGGVKPCGGYDTVPSCNLTALAVGEGCGDVIYAGESGGRRIYAARADTTYLYWNNGTSSWTNTGATSVSDGLANTNTLTSLSGGDAPYNAALACRALGAEWYLPARDELLLLYANRFTGEFAGTYNTTSTSSASRYWSSTQTALHTAYAAYFQDGNHQEYSTKNGGFVARCVRRD